VPTLRRRPSAIIDGEWPALKQAYERWLAADNFAADGTQQRRLGITPWPGSMRMNVATPTAFAARGSGEHRG
jgi:hypothetical protein